MKKKIKFGVVGLVHDHVWPVWTKGYLHELSILEDVEMVAVADINKELLLRAKKDFGIDKGYLNYKEMVDKEQLDAVLMSLPNDEKADATDLLSEKGIHILMDKPMAATLSQANRIYKTAEKTGIKLLVNWPSVWIPVVSKAYSLVNQGAIGNIFEVRAGMSNSGPEHHGCSEYFLKWLFDAEKNGGGALIDYCCYGILYALSIFGLPRRVTGTGGRYIKTNISAEDNASVVMDFSKAQAIATGSWSRYEASENMNNNKYLFSDDQKLFFAGETGIIKVKYFGNDKLEIVSPNYPKETEIEAEPLKEGEDSGPAYFVKCIKEDLPVEGMVNPKLSRDVQEVIEAAYISIKTGKKVDLPIER